MLALGITGKGIFMWVRSEFGVLCNLAQANEVTVSNGTVEARFGKEVTPLAHRAKDSDAWKIFDRIAQELADDQRFLDLSKRTSEPMSSETVISADPGSEGKAL
jgi:hypothetical protein